ncbi:glycosyltransferase [Psittacicella hinzii]|uniref:Glycosyl transferase family 8 n=1 Tax=Psittacicella hinzii TaxID=2028575 RepID=A0A3A1YL38_9GAMM|nr:glycosyltransferase [Psittacicella hinzii]RIY39003.1 hypothetical protein CKF58_03055 [Psittacicella hinzii]
MSQVAACTSSEPMQLAFGTNLAFLPKLATLLKNIIAFNRNPLKVIIIHNIQNLGDPQVVAFLSQFSQYENIKINLHYVDEKLMSEYGMHPTCAASVKNYRIILPALPYQGLVLYMDIDVIVAGSLEDLFINSEKYLADTSLAAVADICNFQERYNKRQFFSERFVPEVRECKFGYENQYLNSGMFLVDLDRVRARGALIEQSDIWTASIGQVYTSNLVHEDQDFLNIVHKEDKNLISVAYNYSMKFLTTQRFYLNFFAWDKAYAKAKENNYAPATLYPIILHFVEERKQWCHPMQEWLDLYNFYQEHSVETLISKPVEFYVQMMHEFYQVYNYTPCLVDLDDRELLNAGHDKVQLMRKLKPWKTSSLILNPNMIRFKSLWTKIRRKLCATEKKQLEFARKIYQAHPQFIQEYIKDLSPDQVEQASKN